MEYDYYCQECGFGFNFDGDIQEYDPECEECGGVDIDCMSPSSANDTSTSDYREYESED